MSAVSDAIGTFQTALVSKLQEIKDTGGYFTVDPDDNTYIRTDKNVKVIGNVHARGDIEGNLDIT